MWHAVILAGGGGTRLWPASRRRRPKQLLPLGARPDESLLAATARRLATDRILIVTAKDLVGDAAREVPKARVLGEPAARNTAAAIGWAAVELARTDPDALMGVLPADHHIADEAGFRRVIDEAVRLAAERDAIVTIGVRPTRAETGFGYLALGGAVAGSDAHEVARFVEKPARADAERFVASGDHLWNGGMFFFRAKKILAAIRACLPALADGLDRLAAGARPEDIYPGLPSISIDHGVMEKTKGILTVPGDFGWNDVGAWTALSEVRAADADGNVRGGAGEIIAHDARRNIVVADDGKLVALVGVEDLVVVQTADAVLVVPRARAQDVKEIVAELERRKLTERFG
jgi:mannose-1-phosphate guanylyltransferase